MGRRGSRARKSEVVHVRVFDEEKSGLQKIALDIDATPSEVMRRLLREVLNGAPEYFSDGLEELAAMRRELAAVGRNLNQLVRVLNAGGAASSSEIESTVAAVRDEVRKVEELYRGAVERIQKRGVNVFGGSRA